MLSIVSRVLQITVIYAIYFKFFTRNWNEKPESLLSPVWGSAADCHLQLLQGDKFSRQSSIDVLLQGCGCCKRSITTSCILCMASFCLFFVELDILKRLSLLVITSWIYGDAGHTNCDMFPACILCAWNGHHKLCFSCMVVWHLGAVNCCHKRVFLFSAVYAPAGVILIIRQNNLNNKSSLQIYLTFILIIHGTTYQI